MILVPIGTVTIASGASLSTPANVGERAVMAIQMPATWTAAGLAFQAAPESGSTYQSVYRDDGTGSAVELTVPGVQDAWMTVQVILTAGLGPWIKVRSGTNATPVNQGGARTIVLWGRDLR